jgi:cell division protein FtsI/penicillin-binding protein 2
MFKVRQRKIRLTNSSDKRLIFLNLLVFIFSSIIIIRLFDLQILNHKFYTALASGQHEIYKELFPERGKIFMREIQSDKTYPLAVNQSLFLVYAEPRKIKDPNDVAEKLFSIFGINDEEEKSKLKEKLSKKGDPYEPLKHKVTEEIVSKIKELNIEGIGFAKENFRYYPEKNIGSHVVGFVGFDKEKQVGRYGIESYFDQELSGKAGYFASEKDVAGRWIPIASKKVKKAEDGSDIILTIDRNIQFVACDELKKAVEKHGADGGTVIIMDPKTGAIWAMCSYPDFDPNEYSKVRDINLFNNPAIFYQFEPGSVFKPITMAAALDLGKVTPTTVYNDEGSVKIGGYTIFNSDLKAHGIQTMTQVLEESLNTGAVFVVRKIGGEAFKKYVENFGFGTKTGIELETEVAGDIKSLSLGKEIYSATASFGQGIAVTPIQIVTAYAAIANGGKLVKPYIVDEIIKSDGTKIKTQPQVIRQVISERTATLLGGMLVSVVERGHGRKAGVPGYYVAGKTGTAQVPKKDGKGYEPDISIGSFAGFAPVDDPKFVMFVKIDHPRDVIWAESSAAPLFGEIAKFMLNYLKVPPNR